MKTLLFIGLTGILLSISGYTLVNRNTLTRGLTKIQYYKANGKAYVKIWGSCSPKDCYWGSYPVKEVSKYHHYELLRANPNRYYLPLFETISISQRHAKRKIRIAKHKSRNLYQVSMESDYTHPDKEDTQALYVFEKQ